MLILEDRRIIEAPIERCFDLARSVEVHLLGNIHYGEAALAVGGATSGLLGLGQQVTWRARHFHIRFTLSSRVTAFDPPVYFQDTMLRGPFRSMRHDHFLRALSPNRTEIHDRMFLEAPLGPVGRFAERLFLGRYMQALLRERNAVIQRVAESNEWRGYLPFVSEGKWLE